MHTSHEHFTTIVYAKFGGQTECIMGNWKIENETGRLNQGTSAGKPKQNGEIYQNFIARENVWEKPAEQRVATLNDDTDCVEEKVSCSSVFNDLPVVSISGR